MERKIKKMDDYLYYKPLIHKFLADVRDKYKDNLVSVIVFGSIARGKGRKESDVDILLIIDSISKIKLERQEEFIEVENEIKGDVNEPPEEAMRISPLYLDMVEDAIITYDKNDFFKNILEKLRNKLKELGSKRVSMGKRWYWVCRLMNFIPSRMPKHPLTGVL
jgi:predicted nucleotidyltransferase